MTVPTTDVELNTKLAPPISATLDSTARVDLLRKEAVPALRAATDTQRQVALLQATVERIIAIISELPGAGFVKRMTAGRLDDVMPQPPADNE